MVFTLEQSVVITNGPFTLREQLHLTCGECWNRNDEPANILTVEGVTALREVAAPTATANYGKLYVKTTDSKLYFMNDSGVETDLTSAASGGTCTPGSQTFTYTGSNQTFVVPAGCTSISIKAWGAGGGAAVEIMVPAERGGAGAFAVNTMCR